MLTHLRFALTLLTVLVYVLPAAARAQSFQGQVEEDEVYGNYLTGYYVINFGAGVFEHAPSDVLTSNGFGAAYTFWSPGLLAPEVDVAYSSSFAGSSANLITATANGILGPWFKIGPVFIRPYGVAGGGLLRESVAGFSNVGANVENKGVVDYGGGLSLLFGRRFGVRGDVRVFQAVGSTGTSGGWGLITDFNWLRASVGASVGF